MTSKLAFIGRFLIIFALLTVLGWVSNAPARYATALQGAATVVSPLANGWRLETRTDSRGQTQLWFRHGARELRLLLSLQALALGLLPLLSLMGATPGMGLKLLARRALLGCAALFGLDLLVLLFYPLLVSQPNPVTDIFGTFLGLLTFVGGPVILWFVLTYDRLQAVWHFR